MDAGGQAGTVATMTGSTPTTPHQTGSPVRWASSLRFTSRHSRKVHRLLLSIAHDRRRAAFASTYAWLLDRPSGHREREFWRDLRRLADALDTLPDDAVDTLRVLVADEWDGDTNSLLNAARTL